MRIQLQHIQEVHVIDLQQKRIAVKQTILEMTVAFFPKMFLYIFLVIAYFLHVTFNELKRRDRFTEGPQDHPCGKGKKEDGTWPTRSLKSA